MVKPKRQVAAANLESPTVAFNEIEEAFVEDMLPVPSSEGSTKMLTQPPEHFLAKEVQKSGEGETTTSKKASEQTRRTQSHHFAQLAQSKSRTNLKEAETLYHQALAYDPQNATALMGLSDIYFELGQRTKALEYAQEAVHLVPNNGLFRIRLGDAYFKLLRYPDAQEQYQEASRLGHTLAKQRLQRLAKTLATPCPEENPECTPSATSP